MDNPKEQLVNKLKDVNNVLVTVSADPSVDQLSGVIGLTLFLSKMRKHATAVFSGKVPSTIEFLKPEQTIEGNTDSLQDFIIALDKAKADKIRYKVEDQMVKIFITPYRTSIGEGDLVFSKGDFNVDIVVALGVKKKEELDQAITSHGRILHDATVATINTKEGAELGSLNWTDSKASSLCEMIVSLADQLKPNSFDAQMATALLTGIVAETDRFSNEKTDSQTMNAGAKLMAAGANQQLVATKLEEAPPPPPEPTQEDKGGEGKEQQPPEDSIVNEDGSLVIHHEEKEKTHTAEKQAEPKAKPVQSERPAEAAKSEPVPGPKSVSVPSKEEPIAAQPPKEAAQAPAPVQEKKTEEEPPKKAAKESVEAEKETEKKPTGLEPMQPTIIEPETTPDSSPAPQISINDQGEFQSLAQKHSNIHIKPEHREFLNVPPTTQRHDDSVIGGTAGQSLQPGSRSRIAGPPSMGGKLNAVADDEDQDSPMNLPPVDDQPLLTHDSEKTSDKPTVSQSAAKPTSSPDSGSDPSLAPQAAASSPEPTPPPEPNPVPPPMPAPQPEPPQQPTVPPPAPDTDEQPKSTLPDSFIKVLDDETLKELEKRTESPHRMQAATGFEDKTLNNIESKVHSSHLQQPEPAGMDYEAHESEPLPKPLVNKVAEKAAPTEKQPPVAANPIKEPVKQPVTAPPQPAKPSVPPASIPSHPAAPTPESPVISAPAVTPSADGSAQTLVEHTADSAREAVNKAIAAGDGGHASMPALSSVGANPMALGSDHEQQPSDSSQSQGSYPHIDHEGNVTFKGHPAADVGHNSSLQTPPPSTDPTSSRVAEPTPPPPVPPPLMQPHPIVAD